MFKQAKGIIEVRARVALFACGYLSRCNEVLEVTVYARSLAQAKSW
jgi:hypothetical protein